MITYALEKTYLSLCDGSNKLAKDLKKLCNYNLHICICYWYL